MNDEVIDQPARDATPAETWRPSPQLQTRLLHGIIAVVIASTLAALGSAAFLTQGNQQGFTLAMGLGFASILPQVWVLLALLGLARETDSGGLRRGGVGVVVSAWLFQFVGLADDSILPEAGVLVVGLVVLAAFLGLLVYCFSHVLKSFGFAAALLIFFSVRQLFRLRRWLPGLKQLDPAEQLLIVVAVLAVLAFVGIYLMFSVSLIRLRSRLGNMAAVAGWANLAGLVGGLVLFAWFVLEMVDAANQPGAVNRELDDLMQPQLQTLAVFEMTGHLLSGALLALLFLFVRRRGRDVADESAGFKEV